MPQPEIFWRTREWFALAGPKSLRPVEARTGGLFAARPPRLAGGLFRIRTSGDGVYDGAMSYEYVSASMNDAALVEPAPGKWFVKKRLPRWVERQKLAVN
jgi:hypothetical protein